MENQHNYTDLIERFLEGSMNEEEQASFNRQLELDPLLAEEYRQRIALQESWVEASKRGILKNQIGQSIAREKQAARSRRNIWLAAASLILLAAVGSLLIYVVNNSGTENQFAKEQPSSDQAVQGKQKQMGEYGNMDIVTRRELSDDFFPDEYTNLKASDTICFKWPASENHRYLTIYNRKGELVKKVTIKKKVKEYVMMPGVLKPGVYYWKFMEDSSLIRITVTD